MKTKKPIKKTVARASWEKVGEVGVDSGQLLLADPCYVDSYWLKGKEPAGHPPYILSAAGRARFPELKAWRAKFPFAWGKFDDVCPELGMSMNDAGGAGLVEEVDLDPVREFSYRGACDVSHLKGEDFGQLDFPNGNSRCAVAFSTGYGDGVYPVLARRNKDGRIVEVRIVMGE